MAVSDEFINPLIDVVHDRYIDRPDSFKHTKKEWHPVAAAIAKLGSLLHQKGHRWNKGEKLLYRRAILSVKHPCCPTCGKPMNESAIIIDGSTHKSWYCTVDQNL